MAFTEAEKVKIRRYMGWPPGKTEPMYDSQIQRIQSTAEGGVMVDSSSEDEVRSILADLAQLQTDMKALWPTMEAGKVDELAVDGPRGIVVLRGEGRRLVMDMATILDAQPLRDAFSPSIHRR